MGAVNTTDFKQYNNPAVENSEEITSEENPKED